MLINFVCLVIVRSQCNHFFQFPDFRSGFDVAVEHINILLRYLVVAQVIEQRDKILVLLAEDLLQFDINGRVISQCVGFVEPRTFVVTPQHFLFIATHYRWKLKQVTNKQHLCSAKTPPEVAPGGFHAVVDGIKQIGPQHAYFVNHQQID